MIWLSEENLILEEKTYRVKICGTTSVRDAQMAVDAGADYLGVLVDVPVSERSLRIEQAQEIALSCRIPVVVLLSGKSVEGVVSVAEVIQPYAVHLLGQMSPEAVRELKGKLDCQVWATVYLPAGKQTRVDAGALRQSMRNYEQAGADLIVIDTVRSAPDGMISRYGGTGEVGNWDVARELVKSVRVPVLLAGGINPDNVREAIRKVDPYGVDLASGVERSKCNRDPDKVKLLMDEVRKAARKGFTLVSHSPDFTRDLGREIGRRANRGAVIALCGHLGSGKTVMAQGIAAGLGIDDHVTSPTFVIINEYEGKLPLYHIDTYRLDSLEDMRDLGYEEYFYGDGVAVIEWGQKVDDLLPEEHLRVEMKMIGESDREIIFIPYGKIYVEMIEDLVREFPVD